MKRELSINKSELIQLLENEYRLSIGNLVFLPKGEVGYCYIVECENEADLQGIQSDCLDDFRNIEERIDNIDRIIEKLTH